jgi:hypothetical protein
MTNWTAESLMDRYFDLTAACESLAAAVQAGRADLIGSFQEKNAERVRLMRLLNLVPFGM